jgi:hypothetical protein
MRIILSVLMLAFLGNVSSARADAFYELVKYSCKEKDNFVQVEYLGAYNEEGVKLFAQ